MKCCILANDFDILLPNDIYIFFLSSAPSCVQMILIITNQDKLKTRLVSKHKQLRSLFRQRNNNELLARQRYTVSESRHSSRSTISV